MKVNVEQASGWLGEVIESRVGTVGAGTGNSLKMHRIPTV